MKFNKRKCQVLHLGWNSLRQQELLGAILVRSSLAEKALELDTSLTMSQQCVLEAILGCIRQSVASSLGEVILSLCPAQVRSLPRVQCPGLGSSV